MRGRLAAALTSVELDYKGVTCRLGEQIDTEYGVRFQLIASRTVADVAAVEHDLAAALNRAKEKEILRNPADYAVADVAVTAEFGIPGFGWIEVLHHDPLWDRYPWPYDDVSTPLGFAEDPFAVGVDRWGEEYEQPLVGDSGAANLLIFGGRGSGKSNLLNGILRQKIPHPHVRAWLIDMKGGMEFNRWGPYAHRYATHEAEALAMWKDLRRLIDEKTRSFAKRGITKMVEFSEEDPYDLVVVDEGAVQFGNDKIVDVCAETLWLSRAAGAGAVMAMQQPTYDVIPTKIRDAGFDYRMSLLLQGDYQASQAALGQHVPPNIAPHTIQLTDENRGLLVLHDGRDWRRIKCYEHDYDELDELCAA